MMVLRIIARRISWPDLARKPSRSGLRLRWDAVTEAGDVLVWATEHPLADGAHVLAQGGLDVETLVTMRHQGAPHIVSLRIPEHPITRSDDIRSPIPGYPITPACRR